MRATQTTRTNVYARQARTTKIVRLREAVYSALTELGCPGASPSDAADAFGCFSLRDWSRFALAYGINPPSQETVDRLLATLRATPIIDVRGEAVSQ